MKKKISITVDENILSRIAEISEKTGFNQSSTINYMLDDLLSLLDEMESQFINNDNLENSVKYIGIVSY